MFSRFTDQARKVMQFANQEAQRFHHEYIGTEHILLGLVKVGSGVAANVLKHRGIDLRAIRQEVEKIVQPGPERASTGQLPQTLRAKKVIEYSIEEARNLNHNYIGTEHLLLGLLREEEGVAAQVLLNLGLGLDDVRKEMLKLLGHTNDQTEDEANHGDEPITSPTVRSASRALDAVFRFLQEKKEAAVSNRDFEWAARLRDLTDQLRKELNFPALARLGQNASSIKECDFYVPLHYKDGMAVEAEQLARIRQHLMDEFGGFIEFRQHVEGSLQLGNVTFRGKIVIYRVYVEPAEGDREFFLRLKEELKSYLRQEEIVIAFRTVYRL